MHSLDRYILSAIFPPLIGTVVIAVMLLLLEQMLRLFDFVLIENGPVYVVWTMLAFLVPEYLALAVSLGLFLGVLLGFRKLSLSSELDAALSSGVSLQRMMRPVYFLAMFLMALNFAVVAYVQPYSLYGYSQLKYATTTGALGVTIPAGEFFSPAKGLTLRVGSIRDEDNAELKDVFLRRCGPSDVCTVITAARGTLFRSESDRVLKLRVFDGTTAVHGPNGVMSGVLSFEIQDVPVDLPRFASFRARGEKEQEATFIELIEFISGQVEKGSEAYNQYRGEFHYRLLHTLSFIAIPLMALPFGLADRRRVSNAGPIIGVAVLVIYNEFLEAGQRQVALGDGSPWLAMWPAFLIFTGAGALLFYRAAENPGRRQFKTIEWMWEGLAAALKRVRRLVSPDLAERAW